MDEKVMALLEEGRKRAAGLLVASVEEDTVKEEAAPAEDKKEPKPN